MPQFERAGVSIYYEEHGNGFPLLLLAPGGLNSTIDFWTRIPINPLELFKNDFRVIAMDQRNAGRSTGPLPVVDPWGAYIGDQLGLMDHLGIDRFLVIGCCIGCSYILKLAEVQSRRIVAGIMMQPIGLDDTNPGYFKPRIYKEWGEQLAARRPDISADDVDRFGTAMWDHDFVISAPRESLSTVQIPMLVMAGNDMAHPFGVGVEVARLLPRSELIEQWRQPEAVPNAIARMRQFLEAHTPLKVA